MKPNLENLIKESKDLGFDYDHHNHQILLNAIDSITEVEGIVCEIGLRKGGGLVIMMLSWLNNNHNKDRYFIAIDPYGNIDYKWKDGVTLKLDYTNKMKNETLSRLYSFCSTHNINFNLFCLTDFDFFDKFENGVIIYDQNRKILDKYALVHLDGPHTTEDLIKEIDFFKPRISLGGFIVLDDVQGYFNLQKLEEIILCDSTFVLVENDNHKASYKKIK